MSEPASKPHSEPAPKPSVLGTLQDFFTGAKREQVWEAIGYGFLELAHRERQRRPGRPKHDDVTEALRLESEGLSRKEIYRRLDKKTPLDQKALKEAMRARKYRQRRRDKTSAITPTNGTPIHTV